MPTTLESLHYLLANPDLVGALTTAEIQRLGDWASQLWVRSRGGYLDDLLCDFCDLLWEYEPTLCFRLN